MSVDTKFIYNDLSLVQVMQRKTVCSGMLREIRLWKMAGDYLPAEFRNGNYNLQQWSDLQTFSVFLRIPNSNRDAMSYTSVSQTGSCGLQEAVTLVVC
jgi:hypothetical protein